MIWGKPERPAVCASFQASLEMCGTTRDEALANLAFLEIVTRPGED
jgi:hypothetical protein